MAVDRDSAPVAVSLFSGAGGLDIGLEDAGFDVRLAVEIDGPACTTLRENALLSRATPRGFDAWWQEVARRDYAMQEPEKVARTRERVREGLRSHRYFRNCEVVQEDIRALRSSQIMKLAGIKRGDCTVVAGGPPCQSFSRSGQRKSVDDDRGQLFLEFVRVVRDLRPRWFLFENVRGLVNARTTIWGFLCSSCGHVGIPPFDPDRVEPDEGSPGPSCPKCKAATRWRVERKKPSGALEVILAEFERTGYRCHPFILDAVEYGAPQFRERLFIVGSRDNETFLPPRPTHVRPGGESFEGNGHPLWRTTWESLFSEPNPDHRWPLDQERAVLWVRNLVRPHDEPVTWTLMRPSPTVGAHQGAKLAIAPNGVPEEQLARQQWHVLGRRQGDTPPVYVDYEPLSDRDLLLLQTFPGSWHVAGTRMDRAFQIGNAVPPLLGRRVSERLLGRGEPGVIKPIRKSATGSNRRDARVTRAQLTMRLFDE